MPLWILEPVLHSQLKAFVTSGGSQKSTLLTKDQKTCKKNQENWSKIFKDPLGVANSIARKTKGYLNQSEKSSSDHKSVEQNVAKNVLKNV